MGNEIELKLAVNQHFADFLAQEISSFRVSAQRRDLLQNRYYDTDEHYFARHKMGLRVRCENRRFTLTLKTDGKVTGGLHVRPEYNVVLPSDKPDLSRLAQFAELRLPIEDLVLQPIFDTDFERQSWLVECSGDTEIEVALDQGEIKADGKSEPICEVEFELKQGKLDDLLTFVSGLTLTDGIRLSSASKAQRGYRLAGVSARQITDWPEKWRRIIETDNHGAAKTRQKLTALFGYEQQLIEETVAFGADYFACDFLRTVERIGAFFNLYQYYADNGSLLENALNERSSDANVHPDEQVPFELTESNAYLLEQIRALIRRHSENRDNTAVMNKLIELLHSGQYVKRMINLIKLTVE